MEPVRPSIVSAMGRTAIRLAFGHKNQQRNLKEAELAAYIFDVWTWVNRDYVTMLDAKVVSNHPIHSSTAVVEIIVG